MLSNSQKKYVNSLKQKKFRNQFSSFIVEGEKMVCELIDSDYEIEQVFGTEPMEASNFLEITEKELAAISSLKTPNKFLAIAKQKKKAFISFDQLSVALDNVQDPGNLGTIIRIADWFGIKNVICSMNSVDVYNPKVVQATMGSLFRVNVVYENLENLFNQHKDLKVYGAVLDGESVYKSGIEKSKSVLLMGNESNGISENLQSFITNKISIPGHGKAESLNVATATAILCSEYRRAD